MAHGQNRLPVLVEVSRTQASHPSTDPGVNMNHPIGQPPCSFCGDSHNHTRIGFRAMICDSCIGSLRSRLEQLVNVPTDGAIHDFVPGKECVFCEMILSTAKFSMRRWIFGICDACACSIAEIQVDHVGPSAQSYEF
jgi:hypothetical protein